jgi:GNAT superfamily N-acetyltransferase
LKRSDLRAGWRTGFLVHGPEALISERETMIVLRTPSNPNYYWGNCLVLPQAPRDEDLLHWLAVFDAEIGALQPASRHVTIGINDLYRDEPMPSWRAAGFELHIESVMRLLPGELRPPTKPPQGEVLVRPIDFASEVPAIVELECQEEGPFEPAGYRRHRYVRFERYAQMHAEARLQWFGVWCDGVLAASCGLMRERAEAASVARFQHVFTHPAWRRRGLCSALVQQVSRYAFDQWQVGEIYMLADVGDVAIHIYRALGYRDQESEWSLQRNAPEDRGH